MMPVMPSLELAGRQVDYRLVRNARAHGLRLVVDARGVRVTMPRRASARMAEAALRARSEWVLDALDQTRAATPPALAVGDTVPVLGAPRTIGAVGGIPVDASLPIDSQVERWLRAEAGRTLVALVDEWAPRIGVTPRRVVIRGQRSRWGSASTRGEISLNWRLVMAPPEIGEYVVIHELAHLVVMDHSPRYWAVVARYCPDHAARRRWLRRNAEALMQGPAGAALGSVEVTGPGGRTTAG
jgi:predicted metal-dependent hydrolase